MTKEPLQFVYMNSLAWYGARLAMDLLRNYAVDYEVTGKTLNTVTSSTSHRALLLSFLADREFYKIFKVLERARIPKFSKDRTADHPLVIIGGSAMYQPEPIADLADVICVGDGEEFLMGINNALNQKTRQARIDALAELPGAYIPSRRKIIYDVGGFYIKDIIGEDTIVYPHETKLWMPAPTEQGREGFHKISGVEVARGCNMKCAFCSITWRHNFNVRPEEDTKLEYLKAGGKGMQFTAPNLGGIPYYQNIHDLRGKGTNGDITVRDFIRLPYPIPGEYEGHSYTFGIEGITPRLRRIVGKPISYEDLDEMFDRLFVGRCKRIQLYMIRNVPGETNDDWEEFLKWFYTLKPILAEHEIATELQFTPLTKQAHTPFQWFAHDYNVHGEAIVKEMLQKERRNKSFFFISPSRRQASWAIDNITNCSGRNGVKFLWAQHKGHTSRLKADQFIGKGFAKIQSVASQCGIDLDLLLGSHAFDSRLPWGFIMPQREEGHKKRLAMAKGIARRIES